MEKDNIPASGDKDTENVAKSKKRKAKKPLRSAENPQHKEKRPPRSAEKPQHKEKRPPRSAEKPQHKEKRPPRSAEKPQHKEKRPPRSAEKSQRRAKKPQHSAEKSPRVPGRKSSMGAIVLAAVLFIITFLIYFVAENIVTVNPSEIHDWRFISAETAEGISGDVTSYRKANSENRVAKELGKPYIRLNYTVKTDESASRLVIKTDNNPVRVEINGTEVLDNGYTAGNVFTGNSYNEAALISNAENEISVYMYAPMAFSVHASVETEDSAVIGSFSRLIGFGMAAAALLLGVCMLALTLALSPESRNSGRLMLLSAAVMASGIVGMLYFCLENTDLLTGQIWYCVLLVLQFALMMLIYVTVLSCSGKALKGAAAFLPVFIAAFAIPVYPSPWTVRAVAVIFAVAQIYAAIRGEKAMADATASGVPHVGAVRGLLLYAAVIGLFNACCLFAGISTMARSLYLYSLVLTCAVTYVVFCRQVIYFNLQKIEHEKQIDADRTWIEDVASLISEMFIDKGEHSFLIETAKGLVHILKKNAETPDFDADIHVSVGVLDNGAFIEIYDDGVGECDYQEVYNHLITKERKLSIGSTAADMLFCIDNRGAVLHFENISCGVTPMLENIINTAYPKLYMAYQNISLRRNVDDVQEDLFINLATIAEERDKMTQHHQMTVSVLTYHVCLILGMDENRAKTISVAAMTHDIGKIAVSESILKKNGALTDSEYARMKEHVIFGRNILSLRSGEFFDAAAKIAEQHHENYDGTGYLGIKGRDIDPGARVVRVIDVMDALLSIRDYKKAWEPERVREYIQENKGKLFDPAVSGAVLNHFDELLEIRSQLEAEV